MINILKLKGKIVEAGMNISSLSRELNIDRSTFYRKLNEDGTYFSIKEINIMIAKLNLSFDDVKNIFFRQLVA
ncbi:helix-turn-helix domain-containing protein [Clostridium sp.]|uniref:helix-turn-helix domain-containing protein n=1 Tax=Clostridium sp. TaxID=1506 RepID=UPI00291349C1|nr:helix-turn-helix domain-containing protein [Clostridium sp.]MDU4480237.1 helix-turn-helix domain-containing protein [Clostridium sp.]